MNWLLVGLLSAIALLLICIVISVTKEAAKVRAWMILLPINETAQRQYVDSVRNWINLLPPSDPVITCSQLSLALRKDLHKITVEDFILRGVPKIQQLRQNA